MPPHKRPRGTQLNHPEDPSEHTGRASLDSILQNQSPYEPQGSSYAPDTPGAMASFPSPLSPGAGLYQPGYFSSAHARNIIMIPAYEPMEHYPYGSDLNRIPEYAQGPRMAYGSSAVSTMPGSVPGLNAPSRSQEPPYAPNPYSQYDLHSGQKRPHGQQDRDDFGGSRSRMYGHNPLQSPYSVTSFAHSSTSTPSVTAAPPLSVEPQDGSPSVPSSAVSLATRHKYSLLIRQQPRAARAGPEGRDRRPIDPPVVLQLQILDFDPNSEEDMEDVKSPFWVVHCYLFSGGSPAQHMSVIDEGPTREGGSGIRKLLIGCHTANSLFAAEDPDPETAVPHPSSLISAMPSAGHDRSWKRQPGAFFIFSDISIRMAGTYRLQFVLMKIDVQAATRGNPLPSIATVMTQPFVVNNAKGFDRVQESTNLVRGLAKIPGAPSTLKIKKGPAAREKARQRREEEEEEDEADSDEDDE